MKIIIGLGNPGKQYEGTRHNIGFHVIDELSNRLNIPLTQSKFNGMFGIGHIGTEKVMLLKPFTFIPGASACIVPMMDYYEVNDDEIVVIYDDLDLQVGKLRLRQKGSAGGHNGIKSIIQHLGSQEFNRIRIGVDRPNNGMKVPDYVLSKFNENEKIEIIQAVKNSADACEDWFGKKFLDVMNTYNGA